MVIALLHNFMCIHQGRLYVDMYVLFMTGLYIVGEAGFSWLTVNILISGCKSNIRKVISINLDYQTGFIIRML